MTNIFNRKLKLIIIAADKYPPFRVDVSVLFGKEIIKRGHKIDWVLQSEIPVSCSYETNWNGCKVFVGKRCDKGNFVTKIKYHYYNILNDFRIFKIIGRNSYDFVIVKDKYLISLLAIIISKFYKIKFIFWLSFPFPESDFARVKEKTVRHSLLYWLRGIILYFLQYKIIFRLCEHAFVQTDYMKKFITQKNIPETKMTAIPMAVSMDDIFQIKSMKNKIEKNYPKIIYLGVVDRLRKIDFLLRTFRIVLRKEKLAELILVGWSKNRSDINFILEEAKRLKIDHAMTITGFLPREEAWQYVAEADVCVSPIYPSLVYNMGSPTKLLEYMAMERVCVANDHPEQQIILSESGGGICVPYDETAFAEAILFLLKNQDVAQNMGKKGKKYIVEKRNYRHIADILEQKLLSINKNME